MDRPRSEWDKIALSAGQVWKLDNSGDVFRLEEIDGQSDRGDTWRVSFLNRQTRLPDGEVSFLFAETIKRRCNYLGMDSVIVGDGVAHASAAG